MTSQSQFHPLLFRHQNWSLEELREQDVEPQIEIEEYLPTHEFAFATLIIAGGDGDSDQGLINLADQISPASILDFSNEFKYSVRAENLVHNIHV